MWKLFKILITLLIKLYLIFVASRSTSSSLKVMELIISLAMVQLGAIEPLKTHTMLSTFSTKWCGFTILRRSIICALVSLLIEASVISTAY